MVLERSERQEYLETNYNFTCACDACTGDVPTMRQLPAEENLSDEAQKAWSEMLEEAKLLQAWRPLEEMENRFLKICEIQNRLQMLAPRPSRVLYKAEQYFWKAQRLAYGNKGYMHCEGNSSQRFRLDQSS